MLKGYSLATVARQLLYAWIRDAQKNVGLGKLQMTVGAYKSGDKSSVAFTTSLGSSRNAQKELKKRSATMSQLIATLLTEWMVANENEGAK